MKYLQKLGKSLMLPVACLPVASILMGIGYWIDPAGWGANNLIAAFMIKAGSALIDNMGILFAIGVGIGMSDDNDGTAGLAGLVSWLMMTTLLSTTAVPMFKGVDVSEVPAAFGKIQTQFTGILAGIIGATCYNKFKSVKLPAGALAMYHCSKKENKKKVGAILFSAALASFFTGVTEPLEFAFMFVAPILYLIHAFLTGIMLFIAASLKWMAGFGFSAGLIDYILSFKSPFANNILFLIPLGVICGVIYYVIFRMLILRYDLMTPGREKIQPKEEKTKAFTYDDMAIELLDALGGKTNVLCVDHCITRLRVEVKNISIIDKQALSNMNFSHFVETSKHEIQIIIGTEVQFIAEILNEILM